MADFVEEGSGSISWAFTDRNGDPETPNWIKWTWTTIDGETIINSREQVTFTPPAASIEILLSGDDLQILESEIHKKTVSRKMLVEIEYDSDLGNDLPLKGVEIATIENLAYVGGAP